MRIVLFWADFLHYHVSRIQASYQLAAQRGHEIFAIAVRPGAPEFPVPGYQHLIGGSLRILADNPQSGDMQSPFLARRMVMALSEIDPDVVAIAGYDSRVALAALGWCRRNRRGAILMMDSKQDDYHRMFWKETIKRWLVAGFDSALVAGVPHIHYAATLGFPSEAIFTGYDAVDNDFWATWAAHVHSEAQNWRQHLKLPEHFFLAACRLVPKKNVAGLLKAYACYVTHEQAPWPLVIVGDGPLRTELENLAHGLGVAHLVHFLGYLSAEQMGPVYGLATVFILASAYSEQWGLVVNEAMAAGLPVLVSNICGCVPDLVLDGITGYAFDPVDQKGLVNLLAQCSRGVLELKQLGQAAQKHIQTYSPQFFAENLIAAAQAATHHVQKRRLSIWLLPLVLP